jgi:hypothetical protein
MYRCKYAGNPLTYGEKYNIQYTSNTSVSIAVSAVSIDLTAISINLDVSYDEEGVVHPQG